MNNDKTKGRSVRMSGTPIVRQYGILLMRGMIFYVKRNTEQEIHRRIQAKGSGDDAESLRHNEEERKLGLPHGPAASWERSILKNARKDCTSNRGCSVSQGAHTGLDPYRSAPLYLFNKLEVVDIKAPLFHPLFHERFYCLFQFLSYKELDT